MPRDDDNQPISDLDLAKARFADGLKRCRALVAECRSKLVRNRRPANDDKPLFERWDGPPHDGPQR